MKVKQKTIKKPVSISGIGLHTGETIKADFFPADCNTGIIFKRVDIPSAPDIKADYRNVNNSTREVTLQNKNADIHTVEHLLATLSALGITNLIVEINGSELPIGDGSAKHFIEIISKAEIEVQSADQEVITCKKPIYIKDTDKLIIALPSDEFRISFTADYVEPVGTQFATFVINEEIFKKDIALARTFGFLHEVKDLWANNLAQGGSLENAVVIGKNNILNGQLRYDNEFVRHKIMDLLGDLYLLGKPILMDIIAIKSGHCLNIKMVNELSKLIDA